MDVALPEKLRIVLLKEDAIDLIVYDDLERLEMDG
jgi:hypothetical protein